MNIEDVRRMAWRMTIFYGDKISQAGLSYDLSRVEKVRGENLVPVRGVLVVVGVEHLACTRSVRLSTSLRGDTSYLQMLSMKTKQR